MTLMQSTLPAHRDDLRTGGAAWLETLTTEALVPPSIASRAAWAAEAAVPERHDTLFETLPVLQSLEVRAAPRSRALGFSLRVAFWNAERCRSVAGGVSLLSSVRPDVVLLAEMDVGMARSNQRHTVRDLAVGLGAGYAFGVEFIELSAGNAAERTAAGGIFNTAGLHGNAIVSPLPLTRPAILRFDRSGRWWHRPSSGQKRIGGRMATVATLPFGGRNVTFAALHLESHSDAAHRASQMEAFLGALDAYAPGAPAVIGGDFNTSTFSRDGLDRRTMERRKRDLPPDRLSNPVPFEPLFDVAQAHGFEWSSCNRAGVPTQRQHPDGSPAAPFCKLDWFLTRGVTATDPAVVPAVHPATGCALSDHEMILVTIKVG